MKDKALHILMHIAMKINVDLKARCRANGSYQRFLTDKNDCSSPTPEFCAFKGLRRVIAKEGKEVATSDLSGFFLQMERDGEDLILLKLIGAIALLLVESDEQKWCKNLVRENGKCFVHVSCDEGMCGTMKAVLLT